MSYYEGDFISDYDHEDDMDYREELAAEAENETGLVFCEWCGEGQHENPAATAAVRERTLECDCPCHIEPCALPKFSVSLQLPKMPEEAA